MTGIPILHIFLCGLHNTPPPIISVLQAVLSASPLCFFNVPLFSCQVIIEEPMRLTPSPRQQRFRWEGRWCAYVRHTHTVIQQCLWQSTRPHVHQTIWHSLLFFGLCVFQRDLYMHTRGCDMLTDPWSLNMTKDLTHTLVGHYEEFPKEWWFLYRVNDIFYPLTQPQIIILTENVFAFLQLLMKNDLLCLQLGDLIM